MITRPDNEQYGSKASQEPNAELEGVAGEINEAIRSSPRGWPVWFKVGKLYEATLDQDALHSPRALQWVIGKCIESGWRVHEAKDLRTHTFYLILYPPNFELLTTGPGASVQTIETSGA